MAISGWVNEQVLQRRRIAQEIAGRLMAVPGITSIAVIGSVATGESRDDSDIDLLATYCGTFDREAFARVCDTIGRHPKGIATSNDPLVITTALLVEGVEVFPMLGPESYLSTIAQRVGSESEEHFRRCYRSYAMAIVLYDPQAIWPGVIHAVCEAGYRLGILNDPASQGDPSGTNPP